jgi:hypothetical protein
LLYDQWVIQEIREETRKSVEFNKNESTTFQNLWDIEKAVLKGKLIATSAYIKNTERSQRIDLMLHLKLLEKQDHAKPKTSRRELIKIRAHINKIRTKKTIRRITKIKTCFFEEIGKIDKPWQI